MTTRRISKRQEPVWPPDDLPNSGYPRIHHFIASHKINIRALSNSGVLSPKRHGYTFNRDEYSSGLSGPDPRIKKRYSQQYVSVANKARAAISDDEMTRIAETYMIKETDSLISIIEEIIIFEAAHYVLLR